MSQIGLGPGLTPEADDVLCGWLAIHRAAGVATPELDGKVLRRPRSHHAAVSDVARVCASHGEVLPEFAAYVAALGHAARGRAGSLAQPDRAHLGIRAARVAPASRLPT